VDGEEAGHVLSARRLFGLFLLGTLVIVACSRSAPVTGPKRYPLRGTIVQVDVAERKLTIDHQDIPGFMPAMTMEFVVLEKDAALLKEIGPGDAVTASLVVPDSRYWIEDIVVVKKAIRDPNAPARPPARQPKAGDPVPDVALVNQDGKSIRLSDYRGKAVALTFIFTRCPFPDFCPLMMRNFAAAQAALAANAELRARTRLLAVSFDTKHDTPAVLRAYGEPFQKTSPPFTLWELASGTDEAIRSLGSALGLDYVEEAGSFTHDLRTAVIDPQGRLVRLYEGNDWKPEELVAGLEAALGTVGTK
jgi:protein SCO1/2